MRLASLLVLLAVLTATPVMAQPAPFDPIGFFAGRSRGVAVMQVRGRDQPERFTVESRGAREPAGRLLLAQEITYDDGRIERRAWRFSPVAPGRWRVRGSDMVGPGQARLENGALVLRWTRRGGPTGRLAVTQVLTLRPDGAVDNVGSFRLLGVEVARLSERISRR